MQIYCNQKLSFEWFDISSSFGGVRQPGHVKKPPSQPCTDVWATPELGAAKAVVIDKAHVTHTLGAFSLSFPSESEETELAEAYLVP